MGRTLRGHRGGIAVGVVVGLAWTAAKVSVPALVSRAIDLGITPAAQQHEAGQPVDYGPLLRWTAAIAVAALTAAAFTGIRRYYAFRVSRGVETDLRNRIFAQVQRLHFGFHDRVQTGDLMSRANTDLQQIQAFVVLIPLTISNAVTVAAVTVILVRINATLALLALFSLPFLNYLGRRFSLRLHPHVMGIQRESAQLASVVEETVSGVRVVKGFGAQGVQARRLAVEADDVYGESMAAARVRSRYLPAMELLPNIGLILVLGYGGHLVLDGVLSLGQLVEFNVYIALLIWPLRMLGMIIAQGQRSAAAAERVDEVLGARSAVVEPADPRSLPTGTGGDDGRGVADRHAGLGDVVFDDVTFAYDAAPDRLVLDGFSLHIRPGESVALVGATGSGKSTVARLLPRFYDVRAGAVRIDGVDVRQVPLAELRRAVGVVFEETFLFNATIGENIAFADLDADDAAIERAARLAGADEFVRALPDGYRTEIGERGFALSGGQRQRVAIARAILADPRVLILDDATSAVDPTKEHEIRDALTEVMRNRTTIVIAHRPATIALADRVVLLDGGRVAAVGTHAELLAGNAAYRAVLAAAAADDAGGAGAPDAAGAGVADATEHEGDSPATGPTAAAATAAGTPEAGSEPETGEEVAVR